MQHLEQNKRFTEENDDGSADAISSYAVPENDLTDNAQEQERGSRPRLLLMGLRRSGKSSIQKVVFHKFPPNETLFLESTNWIVKDEINSFVDFQVWDFPGQIDFFENSFDYGAIFCEFGALVWIIDAQDDYYDSLIKLHSTIIKAVAVNPNIVIEVLVHKVDGLSDEYKLDIQNDIQQRILDELSDDGLEHLSIYFHLTSIFDHSIFEAFSKIIQRLIPQLPTLENLLNAFCSSSAVDKIFLFDVQSKIYIATDSSPVDLSTYELCSDCIDVIIDMSSIYVNHSERQSNSMETISAIKLRDSSLYLRQINRFMAVICLIRSGALEKAGLFEYNMQCLRKAIREIFELVR